jgi:hypothetical protein
MTQVDHVTQRNAAAAEQLSSTADQMAHQAASLLSDMGRFHLSERAPRRGNSQIEGVEAMAQSRVGGNGDRSARRFIPPPAKSDHHPAEKLSDGSGEYRRF